MSRALSLSNAAKFPKWNKYFGPGAKSAGSIDGPARSSKQGRQGPQAAVGAPVKPVASSQSAGVAWHCGAKAAHSGPGAQERRLEERGEGVAVQA